MKLVSNVTQEADGGFAAGCLSPGIFTQGNSRDEPRAGVRNGGIAPPPLTMEVTRKL